ncbi:hypothetical protein Hanom_Chr07g00657851 [Helianthus anomalus]
MKRNERRGEARVCGVWGIGVFGGDLSDFLGVCLSVLGVSAIAAIGDVLQTLQYGGNVGRE